MGIFDSIGNFFGNIQQGFLAANEVRKIVFSDPQLFVYPVLALVIAAIAFAVIATIIIIASVGVGAASASVHVGFVTLVVGLFIAYVVAFYIVVYFTTAMLIAFKSYVKGKKLSVGQALAATNPYTTLLLEWSIFYSVISVLLQIVEILIEMALRRFGIIGNIISSIIVSVANISLWLAVLFALPVIIEEKTGPIQTIKKSATFIFHNFGNTFGGLIYADILQYVVAAVGVILMFLGGLAVLSTIPLALSSITLVEVVMFIILLVLMFFLALNPVGSVILLILFLIAYAVAPTHMTLLALSLLSIGIVVIWLGHLLQYVLFNVYRLVIYQYKTEGFLPKGFDKSVISKNIKYKSGQQSQPSSGGGGSGSGKSSDPFANDN